jgi:hypothetical protein
MVARGAPNPFGTPISPLALRPPLHRLAPLLATFLLSLLLFLPTPVRALYPARPVTPNAPDGTVLNVNNTTGDVYISLTSKDNVRVGMPFTCFDSRTGINVSSDPASLGNGSIEVMAVTDHFTRCRMTRISTNRAIQPGDVVFNYRYHYDKDSPIHFTLVGDFDLDGDGTPTSAERDRIVTLIRARGGVIDDTLTPGTNYLVAGQRPLSPATKNPPPATGPGTIANRRTADQKHYDQLVSDAQQYPLFVTILNTNRLLLLIASDKAQSAHE